MCCHLFLHVCTKHTCVLQSLNSLVTLLNLPLCNVLKRMHTKTGLDVNIFFYLAARQVLKSFICPK